MTTLGWFKHLRDPCFPWFEWHYLRFLGKCLTDHWEDLQRGHSEETLAKILEIFNVLELDKKARVDLMLLYHSGLPGRTSANKVLWMLLSEWALDPTYEDLSHKVSKEAH